MDIIDLKQARRERRVARAWLAKELGISGPGLGDIEAGRINDPAIIDAGLKRLAGIPVRQIDRNKPIMGASV